LRRQSVRMLILLLSFSTFPITIIYLAPAPPIMSLRAGVINLSVITILSIFVSGFFFRRGFCGWLCPGGGCQLVAQALNNNRIQTQKINWVRIILVSIWVIVLIAVLVFGRQTPSLDVGHPGAGKFATSTIRYFLPYIPTVIFIFIFVFILGRRGFCHRGCWIYPIIALSTKIGRLVHTPSLYVGFKDSENCSKCKVCTKVCPMSIDVHQHIQTDTRLPNNCIQCGLCIDKCSKEMLGYSFGIEKTYQKKI